jgi:hypothetical protein
MSGEDAGREAAGCLSRSPDQAKAILSLRLRLYSGLRQQGTGLPARLFVARLKPCPSGFVVVLEESSPLAGLGAEEEGTVACCSAGDGHGIWPSVPQRLKPMQGGWVYGTTEVVPLRSMVSLVHLCS